MKLRSAVTAAVLGLALIGPGALPAHADSPPRLDGIWRGVIVYSPAQLEIDFLVEVATAANGGLVGTMDMPVDRMKHQPLASVKSEGSKVAFEFDRVPGQDIPDNRFRLDGELSADGKKITGELSGRANGEEMRAPFTLDWTAEAGSERPWEGKNPALAVLADGGDELRQAFNRDRDKARLVVLLSPTCATCLSAAWVTQKYVLDEVSDPSLKVYVVWGPMMGDEKQEDAREATSRMPDPRVTHFWTSSPKVAADFGKAVKLPAGTPAWDTFQLFAPGTTWEGEVPAPAHFMHLNQPLPPELSLDGNKLAEQVRGALPAPARP